MAMFLALSVQYSKKNFNQVELVTNDFGKRLLIDKYKIPFTSVDLSLNGFDVHPDLFAMAKMKTYSIQKKPFIHIDIDCILWQKISNKILKSPLFFQHKETFAQQPGYKHLVRAINGTTVAYYCREKKVDYSFNCGVVGANDLELIKKWYHIAEDFVLNPANKHFWDTLENKGQMNFLFEQFFIACVTKDVDVKFLLDDFDFKNVEKPKFKMTHLWGDTKKSVMEIAKIKDRLKREFPSVYKRIDAVKSNSDVFADLYKKGPIKYQNRLRKAIKQYNCKSVVYMGYDGIKSSRYIDANTNTDFIYSNMTKHVVPECDLLIIKDMIPLWSGKQLTEFVQNNPSAKYIMDGSGVYKK